MDISEKEKRYQRLVNTRYKYSNISRIKAEKFREKMVNEEEQEIFRRQQEEMRQIELELQRVRSEYESVCSERGMAHKSARLYEQQEKDIQDFERRRDKMVEMRAKKVALNEAKKFMERENRKKKDKIQYVERKKQLLHTDWSQGMEEDLIRRDKRNSVDDELKRLSLLEKELEAKILHKKQKNTQISPVVIKETHHQKKGSDGRGTSGGSDPRITKPKTLVPSAPPKHDTCTTYDDEDDRLDPDEIAMHVLLKLQKIKEIMEPPPEVVKKKKSTSPVKTFKETAVNTTLLQKGNSGSSSSSSPVDEPNSDSRATSYKSLPHDFMRPKNVEELLMKIKRQTSSRQTQHMRGATTTRLVDLIPEESVCHSQSSSSTPTPSCIDQNVTDPSLLMLEHQNERSQFWKDVFDAAGVSFNQETRDVVQKLKECQERPDEFKNGFEKVLDEMTLTTVQSINASLNETLNRYIHHSTPKRTSGPTMRGLDEEKELTLVGSFSND